MATEDRLLLLDHLKSVHFVKILAVEKSCLPDYIRASHQQSNATDSSPNAVLAQNIPLTPSSNDIPSPTRRPSEEDVDVTMNSPPSRSPSPPLPALCTPPRRRSSFADYTAQSSPMTTPSPSPLPDSPAIGNMVADAINRAALSNASPIRPSTRARNLMQKKAVLRSCKKSKQSPPLPLPRRSTTSPEENGTKLKFPSCPGVSQDSSASARDIEMHLTQNVAASPPYSPDRSLPTTDPTDLTLPIVTQAPYGSQSVTHSQTSQTGDVYRGFQSGSLKLTQSNPETLGSAGANNDESAIDAATESTSLSFPRTQNSMSGSLHLLSQAPYPSQSQSQ
ncbi:uncharacterized protein FIBRA_05123 [Fibroporia radiculosa]|uniref:Uncharacterized protein n=1 Tax=Fibroporia radiculosa TaxID=599839 RepID=J4G8L2_9APHY|nr:uncharacterized protein FIBRA_05123 [Fibroporia radiculosa]CCM03008.1 predicted protein [Fibroporia radiculosa]